jgi:hypothetical protein
MTVGSAEWGRVNVNGVEFFVNGVRGRVLFEWRMQMRSSSILMANVNGVGFYEWEWGRVCACTIYITYICYIYVIYL